MCHTLELETYLAKVESEFVKCIFQARFFHTFVRRGMERRHELLDHWEGGLWKIVDLNDGCDEVVTSRIDCLFRQGQQIFGLVEHELTNSILILTPDLRNLLFQTQGLLHSVFFSADHEFLVIFDKRQFLEFRSGGQD